MKFEVSDECLLKTSGTALLGFGSWAFLAPQNNNNFFSNKSAGYNEGYTRVAGELASLAGANQWVIAAGDSKKTKKHALKAAGVTWLVACAMSINNARTGAQPQDLAYAGAVGDMLMGGLCLWRGFK